MAEALTQLEGQSTALLTALPANMVASVLPLRPLIAPYAGRVAQTDGAGASVLMLPAADTQEVPHKACCGTGHPTPT